MDKNQKTIISALALVFALMLGALVVLPAALERGSVVGEFVKPDFDSAAVSGTPQPDAALQFAWLQIGDNIRAGMCGQPTYSKEGVQLFFASDATNTAWLLVKILDEDGNELGSSGLIRPGEYVTFVQLKKPIKGETKATIRILSYAPDTYYSLGSASANVRIKQASAE